LAYIACMVWRGRNDDKPNEGDTLHKTGEFLLPWFCFHFAIELF
jgi:hypothetical protein